jgi:hypothetical protein
MTKPKSKRSSAAQREGIDKIFNNRQPYEPTKSCFVTRGMDEFEPEELAAVQGKLEGWIRGGHWIPSRL